MFQKGEKIVCIKDRIDPMYKDKFLLKVGDVCTVEYQENNKLSLIEETYYWYNPKNFISLLEYRKQKILNIKTKICQMM